jgi:hypothetical protein
MPAKAFQTDGGVRGMIGSGVALMVACSQSP